jgi:hypothetical protein
MSNNYWDDEEDDQDTSDHQLSGDDLVKKLRKAKRADEKRIKELSEQLEGFLKEKKEKTVAEVLAKKGVNAKAASHRFRMKIRSRILRLCVSKTFLPKAVLLQTKP